MSINWDQTADTILQDVQEATDRVRKNIGMPDCHLILHVTQSQWDYIEAMGMIDMISSLTHSALHTQMHQASHGHFIEQCILSGLEAGEPIVAWGSGHCWLIIGKDRLEFPEGGYIDRWKILDSQSPDIKYHQWRISNAPFDLQYGTRWTIKVAFWAETSVLGLSTLADLQEQLLSHEYRISQLEGGETA